jgi:prepilin-type N-terminal cleavage/methylation domain-containing protein
MIINYQNSRNGGFTLVELLVTLAISSFLVAGALTFLVSANKSNQVQSAVSGLNVSGRFGLDQLTRDLRMSGYRDSNWTFGPLANAISATNGASADGGDSITIVYEGARDCAFAIAPGGIVTNTYQIVDGSLECNDQAVTSDVQEMQVYLGEDIDNDGVANRWMSPGEAGLIITRVVAVRIHLLVRTNGNQISTDTQTFFFDNAMQSAEDGQIRREYSVSVALRNPN